MAKPKKDFEVIESPDRETFERLLENAINIDGFEIAGGVTKGATVYIALVVRDEK